VLALNGLTHAIDVPVLLLFGEKDVLNRPDARTLQTLAYGPGAAVTAYTLAGTGSALPLEASAPTTRTRVRGWLCATHGC
jgi:pimeloyl-ACP methyl ester carboxylesterase